MAIQIYSREQFDREIIAAGDKLCFLVFFGPYDEKSEKIRSVMERVADEQKSIVVLSINFKENMDIVKIYDNFHFDRWHLPTIIVVRNDTFLEVWNNVVTYDVKLMLIQFLVPRGFLDDVMPSADDPMNCDCADKYRKKK